MPIETRARAELARINQTREGPANAMRFIKDGYGFFRACVASWQDLGCRFSLDSRPIHLGIFRFPFLFQILVDSELVLGVVALFDDWTMGEGGGGEKESRSSECPMSLDGFFSQP